VNRLVSGCAAAASVVLLSGCAVTGTVVISPDDMVTFNGTVSEPAPAGSTPSTCERIRSSGLGLLVTSVPSDSDRTVGCQVTGSVGIQAFATLGFGVALAHTGDGRYALLAPATLFNQTSTPDSINVAVTFPGTVVAFDPAAKVDGSVVRWTKPPASGQGLWVSSLEGSRLPLPSLLGLLGLGGLAAGLAASVGTLSLLRLLRRRSAAAAARAASGPVVEQPDETAAPDTSEWAPDADR